ncbi:MAG: hypothetical protein CFE39_15715 [Comamonadaceae bacterium PBBC2]|nr:MAG: hypothetical protein CFE39_15715 [Comamonadaceae bacterium PBBC2]
MAAEVPVQGGTLSNFTGSGKDYTATFTPTAGSTANSVISVANNAFSDSAGNFNQDGSEANNMVTMTTDTAPPTIAITSDKSSLKAGQTAAITFTISESVSDFTESDIVVTGGTLSNFQGSGTTYTATFTPASGATTGTISVASNKFSDSAGNFNSDGADANNSVSITLDQVTPTIAITSDKSQLKAGDTATVTFTLSESSTDFTSADVTVTGGTLTNFSGSGKDYTATFTPNANSTTNGVVSVASNKFTDPNGNANADGSEANNTLTLSTDTVLPTIAITGDKSTLKAGETATITFTLTKDSTTFVASDVTVQGGTLSNFTGSGKNYTATFTPTAGSSANGVISVASSKFTDAAGNLNTDGSDTNNTLTIAADTNLPTIAITADKTALKIGDTTTVTFTLSKSSTDFASADVTVTGGTLSNFAGSGTTYTATFTPTAGSTTSSVVSVASSKFTDALGNQNSDGADANNTVTMTTDTVRPTIAITRSGTGTVGAAGNTITFTLSEVSTTFDATDIDVTGGTLGSLSTTDNKVFTAIYTPDANTTGTGTIGVASDKFTDAAGNTNKDTYASGVSGTTQETNNQLTFNTDSVRPTIAITRSGSGTLGQVGGANTDTITFTLSESVTDFALADIDVTNGTLSNFAGSGTTYTATFTPAAGSAGTATIGVDANKFSDAGANFNTDTYKSGVSGTVQETNNTVSIDFVNPAPTQIVTITSMTKDTGIASNNNDWITADTSAGRLVSGSISSALKSDEVIEVYANGVKIGNAQVSGTQWEITDINGYGSNASWTYTAKVVNTGGASGEVATQVVNTDLIENSPVILSVVDSAGTSVANNGTTSQQLSTISGTGTAGSVLFLYDNSLNYLVGSTTVGSDGKWSVSGGQVGTGSNTFSAKQIDVQGNESVLSNLWTVTSNNNLISNGDFSSGNTGFATTATAGTVGNYILNTNTYQVSTTDSSVVVTTPIVASTSLLNQTTTASNLTWSKTFTGTSVLANYLQATGNPDGAIKGSYLTGTMATSATIWEETADVVAGKTYSFKFDYTSGNFGTEKMNITIDGVKIPFVTNTWENGHFVATYVAPSTKTITLSLKGDNTANGSGGGDYWIDNFKFGLAAAPAADNSLVAVGTNPATPAADSITYSGGLLSSLEGNDTLTVATSNFSALLGAGGMIDGGSGVDTLKLAAGTKLSLPELTSTQTVMPLQEVEIIQMQGNSSLEINANNVLSLGGANLAGYSFASTTGGAASTSSTGKVQMVINGTSTDTIGMAGLVTDGLGSNTGTLNGRWNAMGSVTIGGVNYKVYDHSTTQAQLLVNVNVVVQQDVVTFNSMTKDSGTTNNSNWITSDVSAGRLVSGSLSGDIDTGAVVEVFANGVKIGNAQVSGNQWEITDPNGYNASWVYTANVKLANGSSGPTTTQVVNADVTPDAAPVITGVVDSASASIANNGNTGNTIATVSGTGVAGSVIYLYDNTANNCVGSATVAAGGTWSVASPVTGTGSNTFSAKQIDVNGNQSVLSNLWTVSAMGSGNLVPNGSFSTNTNYTTDVPYTTAAMTYTNYTYNTLAVAAAAGNVQALTPSSTSTATTTGGSGLSWVTNSMSAARTSVLTDFQATRASIFGTDNAMQGSITGTQGLTTLYKSGSFNVVKGQTYTFSFNYYTDDWNVKALTAVVDGVEMAVPVRVGLGETVVTTGKFTATYTANESKSIDISMIANNAGNGTNGGDFWLDDISFALALPASDNSLVAGGNPPATPNADNLSYVGGALNSLASDDTITAASTAVQSTLAAGGRIHGGAGVDTLVLAAGSKLSLPALTQTQTVRAIQEVEIFQMQGNSTLEVNANDVLSLGSTNLTGFNFSSTTGGSGSTASTGKVQMVVKGTSTDQVVMTGLATDGLGSNVGMEGDWLDKGNVTIGGVTYRVYDHSTTLAQLLVNVNATVDQTTIQITSMTKDSGLPSVNNDWTTADTSAGRLLSGSIDKPLNAGDVVKVYANGTLIGNAQVSGTQWEITDPAGYNANWVYSAKVVTAAGSEGPTASQVVTVDNTEAAPVIWSVIDSAATVVANNGSTTNALSTLSGSGAAGDTIVVYDNTTSNVLGTTTVTASGTWSFNISAGFGAGVNTYAVKQLDVQGNESVLSNTWTVTTPNGVVTNGDFSAGNTGFTNDGTYIAGNPLTTIANYTVETFAAASTQLTMTANVPTTASGINTAYSHGTWTKSSATGSTVATRGNPDGTMTGNILFGQFVDATAEHVAWSQTANVVKGKSYTFSFDYMSSDFRGSTNGLGVRIDGEYIPLVATPSALESGHFTATYVATDTKAISLAMVGQSSGATGGDWALDNIKFGIAMPANDSSLVAGQIAPLSTPYPDSMSYSGSTLSTQAGNDTITATSTTLQSTLAAGGRINAGAGVDTLVLPAGTQLSLPALTNTQTVSPIQEVEIFQMQGNSTLTVNANDVLSLGTTNLTGFNFASTSGGSGSTASTGKVQMVVKGTATDQIVMTGLATDGLGSNTGTLVGDWLDKGNVTIGGVTYRVYDHSTTLAQLLVNVNATIDQTSVNITSMTKDSGLMGYTNDWITGDTTAGRLLSGSIDKALNAGDVVKVYANGTLIGNAQVSGTQWEITDPAGYNANWVYTAKVVTAAGTEGPIASQVVTVDTTEVAPVITAGIDTRGTVLANNASSSPTTLAAISGTGNAGSTVMVYDTTYTNLMGSATVGADGNWVVKFSTGQLYSGSNAFAAVQIDAEGNQSVQSNLFTLALSNNQVPNGNFSSGATGFNSAFPYNPVTNTVTFFGGSDAYGLMTAPTTNVALSSSASGSSAIADSSSGVIAWAKQYTNNATETLNPGGNFSGNVALFNVQVAPTTPVTLWSQDMSVVAGQTYTYSFDYEAWGKNNYLYFGDSFINLFPTSVAVEYGRMTGTYTAKTTGTIAMRFAVVGSQFDWYMDNLNFAPSTPAAVVPSGNLSPGAFLGAGTPNPDALTYTNGTLSTLGSDDTITTDITTSGSTLQSLLAAGGRINAGSGVDTLKLAAGTSLDLTALTKTQTVSPIQEVEVFQLQGRSSLTFNANDVLSLGTTNLTGFNFSSTTGGTSTSSAGKVQMVIKGTATDQVNMEALATDGLGSNTGTLGGTWDAKGQVTIGGVTYNVFDHSTTQAQVLVNIDPSVQQAAITFSSMSKDSGYLGSNNDWLTADGSAGRVVSGFLDQPLNSGDVVKVFSNGTLIGNAVVSGTQWEITDPNAYTANWKYTAQVVPTSGTPGPLASQIVTTDLSEAAPVILSVVDSAGAAIAVNTSTTKSVGAVTGTGLAGDIVYLYDNTATNLVGTTTVQPDGTWVITPTATSTGSNTFAAKQLDPSGNLSALSNLYAVTSNGTNMLTNGDFSQGDTGFAATAAPGAVGNYALATNTYNVVSTDSTGVVGSTVAASSSLANQTTTASNLTWSKTFRGATTELTGLGIAGNPDGAITGKYLTGTLSSSGSIWEQAVDVVAGQSYTFKFDYSSSNFTSTRMNATIDGTNFTFVTNTYESGHLEATYVAPTSKTINLTVSGNNTAGGSNFGDYWLDNFNFAPTSAANSLISGATPPATPNPDTLTYTAGAIDALAGNDVITAASSGLAASLSGGGYINGGAGLDVLKMQPETVLNLNLLTQTQTVKPIQQIEVFEMQGKSSLIMDANDVLSLGGMGFSALNFASTTQTASGSVAAGGSTSSAGKVQFVVNGTSTDKFALSELAMDGVVGTGGNQGNSGLAGQWVYKGTTSQTVNGVTQTYKVYDSTTTQAQVLVDADVGVSNDDNVVTITSVKASGTTTKVITETFDSMPFTLRPMDAFTTSNGLSFKQDILAPSFTIGADGSGVGSTGRALILNNTELPGGLNQWSVTAPSAVTSVTMNYWDMSAAGNLYVSGGTQVATSTGGTAASPFSVTGTKGVTGTAFGMAGSPNDKYFVDNFQVRMEGIAETADIASGGVTRFTTGAVTGTLAAPLQANQYLQIFSNGVSLGSATVNGTSWTYSDAIAAGGENYVAKIMNIDGSAVTSSNSYLVNQIANATPKLTISDDASSTVATGVSVNYTFAFDQAVNGFDATDIVVTNGGVKGPLIQLDSKTWVMSINVPNSGAGDTVVSVADGSFTATLGGASGLGHSGTQAFDAGLTSYNLNGWGVGAAATGSTPAALTTGDANDAVYAVGQSTNGAETINLMGGNDALEIYASNVTKLALATGNASFDGGTGVDYLNLYSTGVTLDLTNINVSNNLKGFESINITGTGNNIVKLSLTNVLNMANATDVAATAVNETGMMVINGNAGDTVQLSGGINWTTVTTGATGASLTATYGTGYNFAAADTYIQLSNGTGTLFIDEAMTRTNV